jgi:gluconate 2-dehydrogenase alpha chain
VLNGEEFEQPAAMVLLCAYAINNVHLMLLSGIGKPYDPVAQTGVIGKNYCYQTGAGATLFFEGKYFNPFMSTGGLSARVDDFHSNWEFDRGQYGYVGGSTLSGGMTNGRPIGFRPVPAGTPRWGKAWKSASAKWYNSAMTISTSGRVMANRYNYYALDPTYRNAFGQPLMRMTLITRKTNTRRRGIWLRWSTILQVDEPDIDEPCRPAPSRRWCRTKARTTPALDHVVTARERVNKYLQSWTATTCSLGACVPAIMGYNPTGPVGALAYWTADAIKNRYLKNPAPLVSA